jgi:hypothetical protein
MAQIDFPSSTNISVGYTFTAPGAGITWQWDGQKWIATGVLSLDDLGDVELLNGQQDDILVYDSNAWRNDPELNGGAF